MITLDTTLPEGALLPSEPVSPAPPCNPVDVGAFWFAACAPGLTGTQWQCFPMDGPVAQPAEPHIGHLDLVDTGGLRFTGGTNSGWVVDALINDLQDVTLALRIESAGEARSLATLNPKKSDTYLFLAEKGGELIWQEDHGQADPLIRPANSGKRWVLASYSKGVLSLAEGIPTAPLPPSNWSEGLADRMTGPIDLFIGCRSHRKGIQKTLGDFVLHDLLIWPDQDCLTQADPLSRLTSACQFIDAERP